jgi:hypothetical protein
MYERLSSCYTLLSTKLKFLDVGEQTPLEVKAVHLFCMSKGTDLSTQHHKSSVKTSNLIE